MNFFNQIRTRIHEGLLGKNLPLPIGRTSISLARAKSVGILFNGTDNAERELVLGYAKKLRAENKKVKLLAYFDSDLKSENFTFAHFNKKQLDWALRPNLPAVQEFTKQHFDLLLNLSRNTVLPLDYVAAHSRAQFRVGPSTEKTFCYDLMIEHTSKQDLQSFIIQVEQYLQSMETVGT